MTTTCKTSKVTIQVKVLQVIVSKPNGLLAREISDVLSEEGPYVPETAIYQAVNKHLIKNGLVTSKKEFREGCRRECNFYYPTYKGIEELRNM